jgi:hypothetical protein
MVAKVTSKTWTQKGSYGGVFKMGIGPDGEPKVLETLKKPNVPFEVVRSYLKPGEKITGKGRKKRIVWSTLV